MPSSATDVIESAPPSHSPVGSKWHGMACTWGNPRRQRPGTNAQRPTWQDLGRRLASHWFNWCVPAPQQPCSQSFKRPPR